MSINSDMNQAIIDLDTAVQRHAMASKMGEEIDRLRAENERLKAGAARFQWMLDNPAHESMPFTTADGQWCVQFSVVVGGVHRRYYKTLDAAIDAAMAQGDKA